MFADRSSNLLLLLLMLALCHWSSAKLPSSITPCARNDPQLERCIINAVYRLRPLLVHGNLGDGYRTPPLEPLQLDNIELGRSSQFQATFSELEATGGSNFIIDRIIAKPEDISYDLWITLPRIDFQGKYSMRLNLLLLDIQGKGNMRGYCDNAKASVKMRGTRYLRHGLEYVKFTKMTMRIQFKDFKLQLDNLFNGDRILGTVGNTLINDNQDLYLNEIVPGLERGLSKKFLDVANEILATATFDEMFPPGRTIINPIHFPNPSTNSGSGPGPAIFEPTFTSRNPAGGILDELPPWGHNQRPKQLSKNPGGGIFGEVTPGGGIIDPRLNLDS
ncbi:PREDICTED: protein takeout [Drosophila arizonae]|uniref:Protein takeout n=1 Tax=Drosophila arizonae TaxID=7263 RepID=A0ABM1PMD5_DROAR|nr:PREDICTED: protein takeout [Drosophila arizonae]